MSKKKKLKRKLKFYHTLTLILGFTLTVTLTACATEKAVKYSGRPLNIDYSEVQKQQDTKNLNLK